jgi:hypothetical protein
VVVEFCCLNNGKVATPIHTHLLYCIDFIGYCIRYCIRGLYYRDNKFIPFRWSEYIYISDPAGSKRAGSKRAAFSEAFSHSKLLSTKNETRS